MKQYKLSDKMVVVINGKGGVGKDAMCSIAQEAFAVRVISAITPIKNIARLCGWNGAKDKKSRKFLSDLKRLLVEYNDLPTTYLTEEYQAFLQSEDDILFVHIRERDQIEAFLNRVNTPKMTLLVKSTRSGMEQGKLGNASDDEVELFDYDFTYWNNGTLDEARHDFPEFLKSALAEQNIQLLPR